MENVTQKTKAALEQQKIPSRNYAQHHEIGKF